MYSVCDKIGNWTPLPPGYKCLDKITAQRNGIFDDQYVNQYDYYVDGPQREKVKEKLNWFWIITIPGILGESLEYKIKNNFNNFVTQHVSCDATHR